MPRNEATLERYPLPIAYHVMRVLETGGCVLLCIWKAYLQVQLALHLSCAQIDTRAVASSVFQPDTILSLLP